MQAANHRKICSCRRRAAWVSPSKGNTVAKPELVSSRTSFFVLELNPVAVTLRCLPTPAVQLELGAAPPHPGKLFLAAELSSAQRLLFLSFVFPPATARQETPTLPCRCASCSDLTAHRLLLMRSQASHPNCPGPFLCDCNIHTAAGEEREPRAPCSVREGQAQHPGIYFDRCAMQKPLSHLLSTHLHSQSLPPPLLGCLQRHQAPDTSDRNYIAVIRLQRTRGK